MSEELLSDTQAERILRRISRLLAPVMSNRNRATESKRETAKERYWRKRCERAEAKLTEAGVLWRGGRRTVSKRRSDNGQKDT